MPVYEYRCQECGAVKPQFVAWAQVEAGVDAPVCTCGGKTVKIMSVPAKPYVRV